MRSLNTKLIKIECKDHFLLKNLLNLFEQKNIICSTIPSNFFSLIEIERLDKSISINIDKKNLNFKEPISLNDLIRKIKDQISNNCISYDNFDYFPYQRVISNNKVKIFLTEIQNNILMNLFLFRDGLEKEDLYKLIWPRDKIISINKLDTHLTNLKNQISNELGIQINFQSKDKNLKLIIN